MKLNISETVVSDSGMVEYSDSVSADDGATVSDKELQTQPVMTVMPEGEKELEGCDKETMMEQHAAEERPTTKVRIEVSKCFDILALQHPLVCFLLCSCAHANLLLEGLRYWPSERYSAASGL